jgi:hypothetical protein
MQGRWNITCIRNNPDCIEDVEIAGLLRNIGSWKSKIEVAGEGSIVLLAKHGAVAGLIEAIKKNAIEASKISYLFCDRLAKLRFTPKVIELAHEVGEDLVGHLGADEAIRNLKFEDAFAVDTMGHDAEESPTHLKRTQVGKEPFVTAGVEEGAESSKNLAFENGLERRTEDQS